jgi:hypothetical protein
MKLPDGVRVLNPFRDNKGKGSSKPRGKFSRLTRPTKILLEKNKIFGISLKHCNPIVFYKWEIKNL